MNTTHHLKTHPAAFAALWSGAKRAEFRKDDRGYRVGDVLHLQEWDAEKAQALALELGAQYQEQAEGDFTGASAAAEADAMHRAYTGRAILARVTHRQEGYGIPAGYVMLSVEEIERMEHER